MTSAAATTATRPVPLPAVGRLRRLVHAQDTGSQFARFLLAGGTSNLVYATLFVGLAGLGTQVANALAVVASTALANELHRRLTFHAGARVGWLAAQWAGGGVALVGLVTTSAALAALEGATAGAGPLTQLAVVATVSGLVGLARFVTLRWVLVQRPA